MICSAIMLGLSSLFAAQSVPLPLDEIVGLTSEREAAPFNQSDKLLIQSPPGFLRVYDFATSSTLTEYPTDISIDYSLISPDDQFVYSLTPAGILKSRTADGALLEFLEYSEIGDGYHDWTLKISDDGSFLGLMAHANFGDRVLVATIDAEDLTIDGNMRMDGLRLVFDVEEQTGSLLTVLGDRQLVRLFPATQESEQIAFEPEGLRINHIFSDTDGFEVLSALVDQSIHNIGSSIFEAQYVYQYYLESSSEQLIWTGNRHRRQSPVFPGAINEGTFPADFEGHISENPNSVVLGREVFDTANGNELGKVYSPPNSITRIRRDGKRIVTQGPVIRYNNFIHFYAVTQDVSLIGEVPISEYQSVHPSSAPEGFLVNHFIGSSNLINPQQEEILTFDCAGCANPPTVRQVPERPYGVSDGKALRLWSLDDGALIREHFRFDAIEAPISPIHISRDGDFVAIGRIKLNDGDLSPQLAEVYPFDDLMSENPVPLLSLPLNGELFDLHLSPDASRLYTSVLDNGARIVRAYDILTGEETASLDIGDPVATGVPSGATLDMNDSGKRLIVTRTLEPAEQIFPSVLFLDPETLEIDHFLATDFCTGAALSADGTFLVTRHPDRVDVWDVRSNHVVASGGLDHEGNAPPPILFDNDRRLLSKSAYTGVVWNLDIPQIKMLPCRENLLGEEGYAEDQNQDGVMDAGDLMM